MGDVLVVGLAEITALVAKHQWDEALDVAIADWREARAPAYANLVEAIASKITRAAIPARTSWGGTYQDSWMYRTRSTFAIDLGPLLDGFALELLPHDRRRDFDGQPAMKRVHTALAKDGLTLDPHDVGPWMTLAIRVEMLARRGPDPRTARALVRFLTLAPIPVSPSDPVTAAATYGPIFDLVAGIGDVRMLPALQALPPSTARDRVIASLREREAALAPAADARAAADLAAELGFTEPARALDVTELFDLVVSDLDDDTPRAILADRWLEVGDPRGEFVALQLRAAQGHASAAELERMASLQRHVEVEWLGDVALLAKGRRFHRGFLEEIELAADGAVHPARLDAVLSDPRLGTVRVLRRGNASHSLYRQVMTSHALRNVEDVELGTPSLVQELLSDPRRKVRRVWLGPALPQGGDGSSYQLEAQLDLLLGRPLDVTIPFGDARKLAKSASLLARATDRASVTLTAMNAIYAAKRSTAGDLSIDITCRDAFVVLAVLDRYPGAAITLKRPYGASIWGPDGRTRTLAQRLRTMGAAVRPDPSWAAMLAR